MEELEDLVPYHYLKSIVTQLEPRLNFNLNYSSHDMVSTHLLPVMPLKSRIEVENFAFKKSNMPLDVQNTINIFYAWRDKSATCSQVKSILQQYRPELIPEVIGCKRNNEEISLHFLTKAPELIHFFEDATSTPSTINLSPPSTINLSSTPSRRFSSETERYSNASPNFNYVSESSNETQRYPSPNGPSIIIYSSPSSSETDLPSIIFNDYHPSPSSSETDLPSITFNDYHSSPNSSRSQSPIRFPSLNGSPSRRRLPSLDESPSQSSSQSSSPSRSRSQSPSPSRSRSGRSRSRGRSQRSQSRSQSSSQDPNRLASPLMQELLKVYKQPPPFFGNISPPVQTVASPVVEIYPNIEDVFSDVQKLSVQPSQPISPLIILPVQPKTVPPLKIKLPPQPKPTPKTVQPKSKPIKPKTVQPKSKPIKHKTVPPLKIKLPKPVQPKTKPTKLKTVPPLKIKLPKPVQPKPIKPKTIQPKPVKRKPASKRLKVIPYLNEKPDVDGDVFLNISSLNDTQLDSVRLPNQVCKVLTNECRPRNPNTNRYTKFSPDDDNDSYIINLKYS